MDWLQKLKVGDGVIRLLAGVIPMTLTVTKVTDEKVICGPWEFNRNNGAEIDLELGWDGVNSTGSYLTQSLNKEGP